MQTGNQPYPFSAKNIEGGGKIAVGTTAVEITFTIGTRSIIISADADNTDKLYIGKSNVTSAGANAITYLSAGDTVTLDYNDADVPLYVVAGAAAQNFWKGATI